MNDSDIRTNESNMTLDAVSDSIERLELPRYVIRRLQMGGFLTLEQLGDAISHAPEKILAVRYMGEKTLKQIQEALDALSTPDGEAAKEVPKKPSLQKPQSKKKNQKDSKKDAKTKGKKKKGKGKKAVKKDDKSKDKKKKTKDKKVKKKDVKKKDEKKKKKKKETKKKEKKKDTKKKKKK